MSQQDSNVIVSESRLPLIAYILYLLGAVLPLLPLAGLIVCYVCRGDAVEWQKSHYTLLIRTFWIGLLYSLIAALLSLVAIGLLLMIGVAVWYLVRVIKGLLLYNKGQPIETPTTWWI